MLTALTVLSGVAAPAVNDYVADAKLIRAHADVRTLAVSLARLFNDVGIERARRAAWANHDLLVGAGEVPDTANAQASAWGRRTSADRIGILDDHLVTNAAEYPTVDPRVRTGWRGPICRIVSPRIREASDTRSMSVFSAAATSIPPSSALVPTA